MKISKKSLVLCAVGIMLAALFAALHNISSSLVLLLCSLSMAWFIVKYNKLFIKNILSPLYLLIVGALLFATLNSVFNYGLEWSLWQVGRSQIWTLIALPLAITAKQVAEKYYTPVKLHWAMLLICSFSVASLLFVTLELLFGVAISPVYIKSGERFYAVAALMVPGVLIFSLISRRYLLSFSLVSLSIVTMGKNYFAMVVYSFAVSFFYMLDFKKKVVHKSVGFIMLASLAIIPIFLVTQMDRIVHFLSEGDVSRTRQSIQVMESVNEVPFASIIGLGVGTKIIEGNYLASASGNISSSNQPKALIVNSQYDVEVGYFHLLARFGLLGSLILFIYGVKGFKDNKILFIGFSLLSLAGASWAGIAQIFTLMFFGFSIGAIKNATKKVPDVQEVLN